MPNGIQNPATEAYMRSLTQPTGVAAGGVGAGIGAAPTTGISTAEKAGIYGGLGGLIGGGLGTLFGGDSEEAE